MSELEIVTYPAPILKQKTLPITDIDERLERLMDDMAQTMYAAPGLGLAAVQVGVNLSLLIYDIVENDKHNLRVLINPRIITREGSMISESEGCLSVPDFRADVKRAEAVSVEGLDRFGKPVKIDAEGLLAIVLQHEIDHLEGMLFIDRISPLKRQLYKRRVMKQLKNSEPRL